MEPAPELAVLLERLMQSWGGRDSAAMVEAISRDPGTLMIGSDPDEWWYGPETIGALMRIQTAEVPPFQFEFEDSVAYKEGTIGWVAARIRITFPDLAPSTGRISVVFREEKAYWRIVQWHSSVPVTNEETLGIELTTTVDEILSSVQDEQPSLTAVGADGSITIMFTDIVGSTAMMAALGEERWLELLAWHDHVVREQTALFGGAVVKGQGDGFMLAFPATGSAAACAIAVQRVLGPGWAGIPVPVRIGMHCGNAKAESGDFFGQTVVVAARISSAADGGEILASQAVEDGLKGAFPVAASRSISAKGIAGQLTVYPVISN